MERRAADVITALTGAKFNFEEEKESVDICQALQEMCDNSRAEGKLQNAQEMARKFYAKGIHIEQIAKGAGCSVETVKEWLGIPAENNT